MIKDVEERILKKNKILFTPSSKCIEEVVNSLKDEDHRVQIMWALDCAHLTLERFSALLPHELRPKECLRLCSFWARGDVKMKEAKRGILACHSIAKEIEYSEASSLAHAIGQAGSSVHVGEHAIGLIVYELTAIVQRCGYEDYELSVAEKISHYKQRLSYWEEQTHTLDVPWASFL
jgi:hypothetical protein